MSDQSARWRDAMVTLYFTRLFTRGVLKGLTHHDSISYPSAERCLSWVAAINAKEARGRLEYRVIDRSFQNYVR